MKNLTDLKIGPKTFKSGSIIEFIIKVEEQF